MTCLTLAVVSLPIHTPEVAWINGIHVTDFPAIEVTPTAAERKAAALLEHAAVGTVTLPDGSAAARLGAQLAMPYYSFGTSTAGIASSKE